MTKMRGTSAFDSRLVVGRHEREVAVSTLELLNQLDALKDRQSARAHALDAHLRTFLNEELELLARTAIEMDISLTEPAVMAAKMSSMDACVVSILSLMRKKFAKLCRDHQREG